MRIRYIVTTIIILLCMAVFLRNRNNLQVNELSSIKPPTSKPNQDAEQKADVIKNSDPTMTHAKPGELYQSLENDLWVNQAIEGFNLIEDMMQEFEPNGNNERLMSALQRILFLDDLNFALRKRGYTHPFNAESAYKSLAEGKTITESLPNLKPVKKTSEKTQKRILNSDKRREYVLKLKKGDDPFSRQLIPVFEKFDEMEIDATRNIELFKDIISYLTLESDAHESFEILLEDIGEIDVFRKGYEKELESIRKVFAYRFKELHFCDPDLFFNEFNGIRLSNINFEPLRKYE